MKRDLWVLLEWAGLCIAGMAAGVFLAVEVTRLIAGRWYHLPTVPAKVALLGLLFAAGGAHGLAMGIAQSVLVKSQLGIRREIWTGVTAIGAACTWAVGGTVVFFSGEPWSPTDQLTALVLGGAALGSLLGAAQWLVLRRHVTDSIAWIPANSLAWIVGTCAAFGISSATSNDPSAQELILVAAAATIAAGAVVGVITGLTLRLLLQPVRRVAGP